MVILIEMLNVMYSRKNILLLISFLLIILTACIRPSISARAITVEELVMTHAIDENGRPVDDVQEFQPDVGRIYCFAKVPALANEKLNLQWYYENNLIGRVDNDVSKQGEVSWFIERPPDNPLFPEGQYRVEVMYNTIHLKDTSFKIEK
jgi:hypothetical protein